MIKTVNTGHELYIFFNKELIYKRWLKNGQTHSMMFYAGEGERFQKELIKSEQFRDFNTNTTEIYINKNVNR